MTGMLSSRRWAQDLDIIHVRLPRSGRLPAIASRRAPSIDADQSTFLRARAGVATVRSAE